MTAHGTVDSEAEAMNLGASKYLQKPIGAAPSARRCAFLLSLTSGYRGRHGMPAGHATLQGDGSREDPRRDRF
ncbi:MAG: hypothetical protein IPI49_08245 [Myxococcales bacterium]|nr:hypothetical protein [Myxococcales bacterium]